MQSRVDLYKQLINKLEYCINKINYNVFMYTSEEIDYGLDMSLLIPEYARSPLANAISYLPEDIIDFVIEKCFFISMDKECNGIHIAMDDFRFKDKSGLIILSDTLWSRDEKAIAFIIAHEVAHAYKKHGFKSFEDTNPILNNKKEREADEQAILWLKPHFKGSFKRYMYKDR